MIEIASHTLPNSDLTDSQGHILLKTSERTKTEVWTRVMGYHRPVSAFNLGKQGEHAERVHFIERVHFMEN